MPFAGFFYGDMSQEEAMALYDTVLGNAIKPADAVPDPTDLASTPLSQYTSITKHSLYRGRRMRTLVSVYTSVMTVNGVGYSFPVDDTPKTYGELNDFIMNSPNAEPVRERLSALPYRMQSSFWADGDRRITSLPEHPNAPTTMERRDPELHPVLQDLGWILGWELTQACQALDDPDVWYPGVDEGIEPVSDEQVELVIWASQRELNRELRSVLGSSRGEKRPAVPLVELPWNVKRAYAERRRWHYLQYGLGRVQWESNQWSWFDIKEQPNWSPPWIS